MLKIKLYDVLQSRGWTQKQLALECKIREATISDMCNNVSITLRVGFLNEICRALDCEIGDVLEYIPEEKITRIPFRSERKK